MIFKTKFCLIQVTSIAGEHSAILSTFIKLAFVIFFCFVYYLSSHFTQVLLYLSAKTISIQQIKLRVISMVTVYF